MIRRTLIAALLTLPLLLLALPGIAADGDTVEAELPESIIIKLCDAQTTAGTCDAFDVSAELWARFRVRSYALHIMPDTNCTTWAADIDGRHPEAANLEQLAQIGSASEASAYFPAGGSPGTIRVEITSASGGTCDTLDVLGKVTPTSW